MSCCSALNVWRRGCLVLDGRQIHPKDQLNLLRTRPENRVDVHAFVQGVGHNAQSTGRCVLADDPALGASAWLLPRDEQVRATESVQKLVFIKSLLGPTGFHNYRSILAFMSPLAKKLVTGDSWYLSIIGVHPAAQGKGLGRALLEPTLCEARDRRVSCYLETFTPGNMGFYRRLGFEAVASYDEPTTRSAYVLMRRDA